MADAALMLVSGAILASPVLSLGIMIMLVILSRQISRQIGSIVAQNQVPLRSTMPLPAPMPGVVEQQKPVKVVKKAEEPPKPLFVCPKCEKTFDDEKKLKRHFGMAHYQEIEV